MTTPPTFTDREKLAEIEQEIKFRHRVYSKRVREGSMHLSAAQRKIQIMTAIADEYRDRIAAQPDLFKAGDRR